MRYHGFQQARLAQGAITKYRFVKHGSSDYQIQLAAASSDKIIGVSPQVDSVDNQRVDVVFEGITEITAGGSVARGDLLTSDSTGRAVATTTAGHRIGGIAQTGGGTGDTIFVHVVPGSV